MKIGLVGTFHIDFPFTTLYDTDRIETYKLDDGIWHGLTLYMCCYPKVFKFIVDKGDVVISGLFLNVLQGIGKGYILEGVCDLLCTGNGYYGAQQ